MSRIGTSSCCDNRSANSVRPLSTMYALEFGFCGRNKRLETCDVSTWLILAQQLSFCSNKPSAVFSYFYRLSSLCFQNPVKPLDRTPLHAYLQSGKIPAELGKLTSVKQLNLYLNDLTGEG